MMKNQIFSLLLSAAIFTTSPLFAMETDLSKENIRPHIPCPSCNPGFKYEKFDILTGTGGFCVLPQEEIKDFITTLPLEDVLAISKTSKTMYNLCDFQLILKGIAEKHGCNINPSLCIKVQIQLNYHKYLKLFSSEKTVYCNVPTSQLKYFMRETSTSNWNPSTFRKEKLKNNTYCFSIGDKQFEIATASWIDKTWSTNKFFVDKVNFNKLEGNFFLMSPGAFRGINLNMPITMWIRELKPIVIKKPE